MRFLADQELWRYALDNDAVIITKDEDFSLMFAMRGAPATVVWIRVGNTRRSALLAWFEPLIDQIVDLIANGQKLIELR